MARTGEDQGVGHSEDSDDSFEAEQTYLRHASACLDRMRERAVELSGCPRPSRADQPER